MSLAKMKLRLIEAEDLLCPLCRGGVELLNEGYECVDCGRTFPIKNGIQCFASPKGEYEQIWTGETRPTWRVLLDRGPAIRDFEESVLNAFHFYGKVLEVGGGLCWASALIKISHPECEVYASDICEEALRRAKETVSILDSEVDFFITCNLERLPFRSDYFDWIFGSSVLVYSNLSASLNELWRVLRPGGRYLGIGEAASSSLLKRLYDRFYVRRADRYAALTQLRRISEWKNAIKGAGFRKYSLSLCKYHWNKPELSIPYYLLVSKIPNSLVGRFMFSEIHVVMEK